MKLAFVILAHNDADNLLRLAKRLTAENDIAVIHWDKKNQQDITELARQNLPATTLANIRFCQRVRVEWGRWPMVEATLSALSELEKSGGHVDYIVLLSGADYPLKPLKGLKTFLSQHAGKEFIECADPDIDPWVVQGLVKERFLHHHWFNWRDHPKLFDWSLKIQKKLGHKRKPPNRLKPHFGSQWWALTGHTINQILAMSRQAHVRRFFKTTWVPDEMFFQTLVASVVPKENITGSGLTFYHFDNQGKPLVFYNDHVDFLRRQDYFFARKLSPEAAELRTQLDRFIDDNPNATVNAITKQIGDYQKFIAVQWRGIPGRRVFGRQLDAWYGDLEWNTTPYFVILTYGQAKMEPLAKALNALPGIRCFGELFHGSHIDYALPGRGHPFYPFDKPELRNMKRPNFLVDLIHANKNHFIGFIIRLPSGNEMEKVVLYDSQAKIIFVSPDEDYLNPNNQPDWSCAFDNMIMQDHIAAARRANKPFLAVKTNRHFISDDNIRQISAQIGPLGNAFKPGGHLENF